MKAAIYAHEVWVKTNGRRGAQLFLSREDFPGIRVKGRQLTGAVFVKCDLNGSLFTRCSMGGVVFQNCYLNGVAFQDCDLSNVTFEDCDMTETLFDNCVTTGINTDGSDLTESNFTW